MHYRIELRHLGKDSWGCLDRKETKAEAVKAKEEAEKALPGRELRVQEYG